MNHSEAFLLTVEQQRTNDTSSCLVVKVKLQPFLYISIKYFKLRNKSYSSDILKWGFCRIITTQSVVVSSLTSFLEMQITSDLTDELTASPHGAKD